MTTTRTPPPAFVRAADRVPHWSATYIDKGYRRGATGPFNFDCWGLVLVVMATHFGVRLPTFMGKAGPLLGEAVATGWQRVPIPAEGDPDLQEGDVLLGRVPAGLHAGIVAWPWPGRGPHLVHASSGAGGVAIERLHEVVLRMDRPEFWRRPC